MCCWQCGCWDEEGRATPADLGPVPGRKTDNQNFGGGPELHVLGVLCSFERRMGFPSSMVLWEQFVDAQCSSGSTDVVVVLPLRVVDDISVRAQSWELV